MPIEQEPNRRALAALIATTLGFIAAPGMVIYLNPANARFAWLAAILSAALALVYVARVLNESLLEDERGRWSLARGQLIAWTVLLIPTFWTIFLRKLLAGVADPLAVGFDTNIAWLLGISGASFVGSPLILARKQAKPNLLDTAQKKSGNITDLFRGEDSGNSQVVDIGRVQMVFFTGVILLAYFAACFQAFATRLPALLQFPEVTTDMLTLLGISHATYLVNKNTDHPAPGPASAA